MRSGSVEIALCGGDRRPFNGVTRMQCGKCQRNRGEVKYKELSVFGLQVNHSGGISVQQLQRGQLSLWRGGGHASIFVKAVAQNGGTERG